MGRDREEAEDAAGRWKTAARINDYHCARCGEVPPYEERDTYFETGLCDWCRHMSEKDD